MDYAVFVVVLCSPIGVIGIAPMIPYSLPPDSSDCTCDGTCRDLRCMFCMFVRAPNILVLHHIKPN